MRDATYGELLDLGEKFLIEAALSSRDKLPNAQAAAAAAEGHTKLIKALSANFRVFTELPSVDEEKREQAVNDAVSRLSRVFDKFIESSSLESSLRIAERRETNNWISAAKALHVAADALRTHLGPERAHRTPDATVLDDPQAQEAVFRRLAEMTLTVGEAQRRLSLRIQEKASKGPSAAALRASAAMMLESHAGLADAAGGVIHALSRRPIPDVLASLTPALLLQPTQLTNPIIAAQRSFQRIRLIAHRQSRGEIAAGIDAARAHATAASLVLRHSHAILAAAPVVGMTMPDGHPLETGPAALYDAARNWDAFAKSTERYASARRSPRLLNHEVRVLADTLRTLTRIGSRWRTPDELLADGPTSTRLLEFAEQAVRRLPDLARAVSAITERLAAEGALLMPTRAHEDTDCPRPWRTVSAEWARTLRAECQRVETVSDRLARNCGAALVERPSERDEYRPATTIPARRRADPDRPLPLHVRPPAAPSSSNSPPRLCALELAVRPSR